ncbi:MAG TPA: hypothetical protein VEQ61_05070 [Thermoleophilaceae bacterium]|nr:hypothetical protein [Thermoleophilaceae bacterium]
MAQFASDAGKKLLALLVLLLVAYVVFKMVLGFVTAVAWIAVLVVGLMAVVWALRVLR